MRRAFCCGLFALVLVFGILGQSFAGLHLSSESANSLSGYLEGTGGKQVIIFFGADIQNDALSIRIQFDDYVLALVKGDEYLRVTGDFRRGYTRSIAKSEKAAVGKLAALLESRFTNDAPFHRRLVCLLNFLASWPAGMPLNAAMDSSTITIGEKTVSREIIDRTRERALLENMDSSQQTTCLDAQSGSQHAEDINSICGKIGYKRTACYPNPFFETKCERVLVGGKTCSGRCGTGCRGLCNGTKYTQDCLNHDRCTQIYGLTSYNCDSIFLACADDCSDAKDCIDIPGVWILEYDWYCDGTTSTTKLYIYPNRTFNTADGYYGKWAKSGTTVSLKFSNGSQPVYTGKLSGGRRVLEGTMKSTTKTKDGCWTAKKTNNVLPPMAGAIDAETSRQLGIGSGRP